MEERPWQICQGFFVDDYQLKKLHCIKTDKLLFDNVQKLTGVSFYLFIKYLLIKWIWFLA